MYTGTITDAGTFFKQLHEPVKTCMLSLREMILMQDMQVRETFKYGMPFYCYKKKMFCYLWMHHVSRKPYIGILNGDRVQHPLLLTENRAKIKIMLFDAYRALPAETVQNILKQAIDLYRPVEARLLTKEKSLFSLVSRGQKV